VVLVDQEHGRDRRMIDIREPYLAWEPHNSPILTASRGDREERPPITIPPWS
jgi:hypothetical protein